MRSQLKTVACLLAVVALAGAAPAEDKRPTVKLKRIALKQLDVTSLAADLLVSLAVENPGPAFTIKDASYRLRLAGHDAGEGKLDEAITVPAGSSVTVDLPLTVDLAALPGVTWSAITGGLKLDYELATEFNVPLLAAFNQKVKTSFSGTLPVGDMAAELPGKLKEKLFGKPK